jgi:short-subunit dehydrogenase
MPDKHVVLITGALAVVARADEVAAHAYRATMRGEVLSIPGARSWLMMEALRISPRAVARGIAAKLNRPPS